MPEMTAPPPALVDPTEDPCQDPPPLGDPRKVLPSGQWIPTPSVSCAVIHLCAQADALPDGSPNMQRLRGRIILATAYGPSLMHRRVFMLHPEHAMAIGEGLVKAAMAALEPPPPTTLAAQTTLELADPAPAPAEATTGPDAGPTTKAG